MKKSLWVWRVLLPLACLFVSEPRALAEAAPKFAGAPVVPGKVITVQVPLSAQEQTYIKQSHNEIPAYALATLTVPRNFDPKKTWPLLIVLSTNDAKTQDREDLTLIYGPTATAQGWVVIAGDGPAPARNDTGTWRFAVTLAALDALDRSFPGSNRWPTAVAGYSGGAKRAGLLSPLFYLAGRRLIGIYLTGINVDTLSDGYHSYHPGSAFLHTPIFLSSGERDRTATLQQQWDVKNSIERSGFDRLRMERFPWYHVVKLSHLRTALSWFLELDRAPLTR
jgi:hypothetical protein